MTGSFSGPRPTRAATSSGEGSPVLSMVAKAVVDRVWGAKGEDIPFKAIPFREIGLRADAYRKMGARSE